MQHSYRNEGSGYSLQVDACRARRGTQHRLVTTAQWKRSFSFQMPFSHSSRELQSSLEGVNSGLGWKDWNKSKARCRANPGLYSAQPRRALVGQDRLFQSPFPVLSSHRRSLPAQPGRRAVRTWTSEPCSPGAVQSEPARAAAARRSSHVARWEAPARESAVAGI